MTQIVDRIKTFALKHKELLAIFFFVFFWATFFVVSQTLFSGYHLTDDHEVPRILNDINNLGFGETLEKWVRSDLSWRFRPFYYIHRVSLVGVFGMNFQLLSIYNLVLLILSSVFLYKFARKIKFNYINSVLFSIFTFLGAQAVIWWQLGNNESIAMFFLSLGLFFMAKSLESKNWIFKLGFILFTLLSSLCKESFAISIPAIIFLNIILHKSKFNSTLFQTIKKNILSIIPLSVIFVVEMLFIFIKVGTAKTGYAGVDSSTFSVNNILKAMETLFIHGYGIIIVAAVVLYIYLKLRNLKARIDIKSTLKSIPNSKISLYTILLLAFLIPQIVLHAKSGFAHRYLLPSIFALTLYLFFLISKVLKELDIRLLIPKILVTLLYSVFLIAFLSNGLTAIRIARSFAREGFNTHQAIDHVVETTDPEEPILIVFHLNQYLEWGYAMYHFLTLDKGMGNIIYSPQYRESDNYPMPTIEEYLKAIDAKSIDEVENKDKIKTIFIFDSLEKLFIDSSDWFKEENYNRYHFNQFTVYNKKL